MSRTLTKTDLAKLAAGRRARAAQERRDRIRRVRNYERWLAQGAVLRKIPQIPSDADYVVARQAGATRRGVAR